MVIIVGILAIIMVPNISKYIFDTRDKEYEMSKKSFVESGKEKIIECIAGENDSCDLPDVNEKRKMSLATLIDEGYIGEIKSPREGVCSSELSYVEVTYDGKDYD